MALKAYLPQKSSLRQTELKRILYVEDEDTNWEVTQLCLRSRYDLIRASDSREAFEQLHKGSFELILMDIQLAGSDLNGIEICKILRGNYDAVPPSYVRDYRSDVPIIFVTAYAARYSKDDLMAAGGDERILKPVDFTRLSLALSRLMMKNLAC